MSLSQVLSAGMPPPYQIYHPTGSQRLSGGKLPYSEKWVWKWEGSSKLALGSAEGEVDGERLIHALMSFQAIPSNITFRLFLELRRLLLLFT